MLGILAAVLPTVLAVRASAEGPIVLVSGKDGKRLEGVCHTTTLVLRVEGKTRSLPLHKVLSVQRGEAASEHERARITAGLAAIQGSDRQARDVAVAELTDIGLPVMSPLLAAYKDTDNHEPQPLYRLFARLIPGYADTLDRTLDLVRMADGETLRGQVVTEELHLSPASGADVRLRMSDLRRIAVRRKKIERVFEVHSLHHCTQIEFLDSGVALTSASKLESDAQGHVRLDFNTDGWSSGPDGLQKPGPNYNTNLTDGFPFGALLGRIGATGSRWLAGAHCRKTGLESGRLYFAVNDNPHWQNNLGSFRLRLRVTDAYDLGDAR
jgi:hypothetical protein